MNSHPFDIKKTKRNLKIYTRALNIPPGAANIFIDQTLSQVTKTLKSKSIITDADLTRAIVKELKKYHTDLAYVYQNRDKII